ncbi:MAG: polyprenyl synthetase family protein [Clostridia bacterium]
MNKHLESTLKEYTEKVNDKLKLFLPDYDALQKSVFKAMAYSVNAGGKRLRPALTMEFAKITNFENSPLVMESAAIIGASIECIHSYSLIHDDLPAMDNDDLRRGKPTNHKVFGEATAILAGDGLLNLSAEIILNHCELSSEQKLDVLSQVFTSSGVSGMIGGQIVDMEFEEKTADIDTLNYIYALKTGALFEAACVSGCICGGDYGRIASARAFARYLGIAFQITDDILDVTGNVDTLGKNTKSDEESCKSTYVSLLGLDQAKEKAKFYIDKAKKELSNFDKSEFLEELCDMILTREV